MLNQPNNVQLYLGWILGIFQKNLQENSQGIDGEKWFTDCLNSCHWRFGPIWSKSSFQSVSWFFYNYPGPFWAGLRGLTNTQPLSLIYKYNICILWVFLELYFPSDYILSQFDMQKCKIIFRRIMTCHFRDKKWKNFLLHFSFLLKFCSKIPF